jgi:hypothetical protein
MNEQRRAIVLWGLKRSGIHLVVGWLYANLGATQRQPIPAAGLHPQLTDGFCDPDVGVTFHNNCGWLHSRSFGLGDLARADFESAAARSRVAIFGLEDCALDLASRTLNAPAAQPVLVLRDPLNNLASRLAGAPTRPGQFRVDRAYIDLFASYCEELLDRSHALPGRVAVNYNRFVQDRAYRDAVAADLGVPNLDVTSEASDFGGGSSFGASDRPSPTSELLTRYRQHPIPPRLVDLLLAKPSIRDACSEVFGYDLAAVAEER